MTILLVIIGVLCSLLVVKYSLQLALTVWIKRNKNMLFMYPEYSWQSFVLTEDFAENALRYQLTKPITNIYALYDFMFDAKVNKYTIWPKWAVNLEGFNGGNAMDLFHAAVSRNDFHTALSAIVNHWSDLGEDNIDPDEAYSFYDVYMRNTEGIEKELEEMCRVGLSSDIAIVLGGAFNALAEKGYSDEVNTLSRAFNKISSQTRPIGEDWLSEGEFGEVMRSSVESGIVEHLGLGINGLPYAETFKTAKENYAGTPALIAAYLLMINNASMDNDAYNEIYNILLTEPAIKNGFSKRGALDLIHHLMNHFEDIEDFEKVAHLHDYLSEKVGYDVE